MHIIEGVKEKEFLFLKKINKKFIDHHTNKYLGSQILH